MAFLTSISSLSEIIFSALEVIKYSARFNPSSNSNLSLFTFNLIFASKLDPISLFALLASMAILHLVYFK